MGKTLTPEQMRSAAIEGVRRVIESRGRLRAPPILPGDWRELLPMIAPQHVSRAFAPHHEQFWDWAYAIPATGYVTPYVGIWPRGGAKSTSAELAVVVTGLRRSRSYVLYVSGTQDKADDHVANVARLLESPEVARLDPVLGARRIDRYGPAAWRHNRVATDSGLTVDAAGLDRDIRGAKLEEHRPDMIVLDDIDEPRDSGPVTASKLERLTRDILPAGATDVVVLAVQNLVSPFGVFARLAAPIPEFLADRFLSGPIPTLYSPVIDREAGRAVLRSGTPSWEGQGLAECQAFIDRWGHQAWLQECQHEVEAGGSPLVYQVKERNLGRVAEMWKECSVRVLGIDLGGGSDAATVIPLGYLAARQGRPARIVQVGESYKTGGGVPMDWYISEVERWHKLAPVAYVSVEPPGTSELLAATLRRYGYRAERSKLHRYEGIEMVQWALGEGLLVIDKGCVHTLQEASQHRYKLVADPVTGELRPGREPDGSANHALDALRYALTALVSFTHRPGEKSKPLKFERARTMGVAARA